VTWWRHASRLALLAATILAPAAIAQTPLGLPPSVPLNPDAADRTGLYAAPYQDPRPGWQFLATVEYGSAIEREFAPGGMYLLDAELMRTTLSIRHDLGEHAFVSGWLGVRGTYGGFTDQFVNWLHRGLGVPLEGREFRPLNTYGDTMWFFTGREYSRQANPFFFDDMRLEGGWRHDSHWQSLLSLTLPTSTGEGYGRGVPTVNLIESARFLLFSMLTFEASAGLGYAPSAGDLSEYANRFLATASGGLRARLFDGQSIYARIFYHSPIYSGTPLSALNASYLSLDAGWIMRTGSGHEFQLSLVEDVHTAHDLAIDVVAVLGAKF